MIAHSDLLEEKTTVAEGVGGPGPPSRVEHGGFICGRCPIANSQTLAFSGDGLSLSVSLKDNKAPHDVNMWIFENLCLVA